MHHETESAYEAADEEPEPVVIRYAPEVPAYSEPQEPILSKQERKRAQAQARRARTGRSAGGTGTSTVVLRALLIALIFVAVTVTAIGTGYAARYAATNTVLQPVFDYLGGTSIYSK